MDCDTARKSPAFHAACKGSSAVGNLNPVRLKGLRQIMLAQTLDKSRDRAWRLLRS